MNDLQIYEEMARLIRANEPFALATVIGNSGSSPRKAGTKMLARSNGSTMGSIGGGRVEMDTILAARSALDEGTARTLDFLLTEEHGFACGGSMTVYIEPHGRIPQLVMFGAGHVGRAVASLAKNCGFRVVVVDDRPKCTDAGSLPCADIILCCPVEEAFDRLELTKESYAVIATPGHTHDFAAVRGALRTEAAFIGLLGSRRKRATLMDILEKEGFNSEQRDRIVTPVGLAIGAETPEEIAVSIVGQLVQERKKNDSERGGDPVGSRTFPTDGDVQAVVAP